MDPVEEDDRYQFLDLPERRVRERNNDEQCACGMPLHYPNETTRDYMVRLVAELGPTLKIVTADGTWEVPRHYLALHGLISVKLPMLAEQYGFERIA